MQIIRNVLIKQVITEESKERLDAKFKAEKATLERECEQLLFEQRKLTNKLHASKRKTIEEKFSQKIALKEEKIALLVFKREQLSILELGSEIIETEVQALLDVEVGMDWDKLIHEKTIVIKDNKVIRIDNE